MRVQWIVAVRDVAGESFALLSPERKWSGRGVPSPGDVVTLTVDEEQAGNAIALVNRVLWSEGGETAIVLVDGLTSHLPPQELKAMLARRGWKPLQGVPYEWLDSAES